MIFESITARLSRFVLSGLTIAGVHWGAIAWALHTPAPSDEESQTGGAFVIELAAITASPDEDVRDIALGEKSEEIAAVAASAPQLASQATVQPIEEEQVIPEAQQPPPEDAVAKPPEEKKPDELKPEEASQVEAKEAPAIAPVNASTAAAPQRIENAEQKSEKPRGQFEGLSRFDRIAIENWRRDLVMYLNKHKRYPAKAREERRHGVVNVAFAMDRTGRVLHATVAKSSGSDVLDQAALDILEKASPLPVPPVARVGDTLELVVPVNYRWRD